MRIEISFVKSRFARRILLLFLLCAFVPTVLVVGLGYKQVKEQLYEQSWLRLEKECKTYALGLMDRLTHMDNLARLYAAHLVSGLPNDQMLSFLQNQIGEKFSGLGLYQPGGDVQVVYGDLGQPVELFGSFDSALLQAEKSTIHVEESSEYLIPMVYLIVPYNDGKQTALLVAKPTNSLLWGIGANSMLPAMTEMAVYNEEGKLIAASMTSPAPDLPAYVNRSQSSFLQFEYTANNESHLASGWSLFLASQFNAQTWTVILSASTADMLGAMIEFEQMFPLVMALALLIVLFLSLYFIRKTLTPLAILQQGTRRVGTGDFSQLVKIDSKDEFAHLADSFNAMTAQLRQQFHTLALIDEIDRSILSSLDPAVIIPRSLRLIADFFSSPLIMLAQSSSAEPHLVRITSLAGTHRNDLERDYAQLDEQDRSLLFSEKPWAIVGNDQDLPPLLADKTVAKALLVLPLRGERRVWGALIVAFADGINEETETTLISQARQIADQLAIALSNARLVSNLEQLSIGTVEALARTVDAKSKWTSGHSERVADLAVRIGRAMRCDGPMLERLFRGGLLHDIGKIGIPMAILDKPGKLDNEEYAAIKTHPELGGKILEPIQPYQDVVPIIAQHHERFDGKGYPAGLAGDAITLGARILCVADVYDALISQRPYREGWVKDKVLQFMRENSGVMFDPQVVEAFFSLDV